jgi:hypothetical protein
VYYKYLRGEAGPSSEVVKALERVFPGTLAWYEHPLWTLAKPAPVNVLQLGELLRRLPAPVRDGWVVNVSFPGQLFWREKRMSVSLKAARLLKLKGNSLDQAAGALGLIHDALLRQDQLAYLFGWITWALVGKRMRNHPVCGVLYPNFFAALVRALTKVTFESALARRQLDGILEGASRRTSNVIEDSESDSDSDGDPRLHKALASKTITPISLFELALLEELASTRLPYQ